MFDLGTQELIVIFLVAFLVFGPRKLPELGRALGKGIRELKAAMRSVRESIEEAGEEITDEVKVVKSDMEDALYKGFESTLKDRIDKENEAADSARDDLKEQGQEKGADAEEEREDVDKRDKGEDG